MKLWLGVCAAIVAATCCAAAETKPVPPASKPTAAIPAKPVPSPAGSKTAAAPPAPTAPVPNKCIAKIVAQREAKLAEPATATQPEPGEAELAFLTYDQGRYLTALSMAEAAASHGDPQAHTLVARIHDEGAGVPKDAITAARWYARAAELCDVPALFAYGLMLAEGRGVGRDMTQAADVLEMAALSGHALANYNLGLIFLRGNGKPENPFRAAQHIRYAAEKGIAAAQYDIASMYLAGAGGLPQDAVEASQWMNRAAVAGYTAAQYDYAVMLLKGLGLNQHKAFAIEYLRAAAGKGVPGAQNRLANIYMDGAGADKDATEAVKWRTLAKKAAVIDEPLDARIAKLPAADQTAGAKRAADWEDTRKAGTIE